jgi:Ca2+/Na+ antiporter
MDKRGVGLILACVVCLLSLMFGPAVLVGVLFLCGLVLLLRKFVKK